MTDYRTWTTAISTHNTDEETFRKFAECGITGVEIGYGMNALPDKDFAVAQENARRAGVEILSVHLPFGFVTDIAARNKHHRVTAVFVCRTLMRQAAAAGIKRFIIHPSAEPIPDEERADAMAAAKLSLAELAEEAASLEAVLCVEDLPRSCLGHDLVDMLELLSADDRLRVCFDVNHLCEQFDTTHQQFIDALGDKIVTTHMSDYDFVDEKHFFPGMGKINWCALITALEAVDYNGPFLYEGGFGPSHWAPEVPYGRIEEARERHLHIKEF